MTKAAQTAKRASEVHKEENDKKLIRAGRCEKMPRSAPRLEFLKARQGRLG